jgi:hypothetical protein
VMARTALGTPVIIGSRTHFFPAPSYASPELYEETARWFDAVIPRLAALQWPDGPIISAQVDNEMGYFFRFEPYLFDHHPEFVRQWREWAGIDASTPAPREAAAPQHVTESWSRFRQWHMQESLRRIGAMMRERGMRVPLYHNDWTTVAPPLDPAAMERSGAVDFDGADMYVQREILSNAKHNSRQLAGSVTLPWIPEIGAGWVSDLCLPLRIERLDEEGAMVATLLCGVRGWNFYMLVERDQWYGSPIGRRGEVRPDATLHQHLNAFLRDLDWWSLQRETPVLLLHRPEVVHAANARMRSNATAAILDETQLPTALRHPGDPARRQHDAVIDAWRRELENRGIDFDEGSADAPPRDLSRYAMVVVPGGDAPAVQHPAVRHAMPAPADLDALPRPAFVPKHATTGLSLHHLHDERRGLHLLGALNLSGTDLHVALQTEGGVTLHPRWNPQDDPVTGDGEVTVRVPAYCGQIWEVRR